MNSIGEEGKEDARGLRGQGEFEEVGFKERFIGKDH